MPEETASLLSTNEKDKLEPKIRHEDGPFKAEYTTFGVLPKMILWTSLGFITAISHHFLYRYLDGRPVNEPHIISNKLVNFQQVINATGNVMALIVNASFKAAICLLFVQQFWFQIRRRPFSAKNIDAMIDMQGNPFSLSALKTIPSTVLLFAVALIIFSLPAISVIAPGALTVAQGNFNQKQDCDVPTTQYLNSSTLLGKDGTFGTTGVVASLPPIQKLAAKVLLLGSYLPPPTPCGACEYNVTFDAPAIQCTSSASSVHRRQSPADILPGGGLIKVAGPIPNLLPDPTSGSTPNPTSTSTPNGTQNPNSISIPNPVSLKYLVWNATYLFNNTFDLQVAWDSGEFITSTSNLTGPSGVIQCTAYSATYYGYVTHGTSVSTMEVTNITTHSLLQIQSGGSDKTWSMVAIADALATQLQGVVWLHSAGDVALGSSNVAYGIGTTALSGVSWNWTMDPQLAIPSLMQNLSLSLLAENVGALPDYPTINTTRQECFVSALTFHYDQLRLAMIYFSGILITLSCVVLGFWTVKQNKMDESINFVRWMDAVAHQDILDKVQAGELTQDTPLQVRRGDDRLAVPDFTENQPEYSP